MSVTTPCSMHFCDRQREEGSAKSDLLVVVIAGTESRTEGLPEIEISYIVSGFTTFRARRDGIRQSLDPSPHRRRAASGH
jgi:hypothetical protein